MSQIRLLNVTKQFGAQVTAVKDLSLEIPNGHFAALLGPSGCGKTTTMNMISGLEKPSQGDIFFNEDRVNDVPPGQRNVGFVFQNYAIFTHMSVFDNIAFGLKVRKESPAVIKAEVAQVAKLLGIENMLNLPVSRLSVNDLQKVALGRSIIIKPRIFLLDEPFSNLDAAFRAYMRTELKVIQRDLGQTMIYVTHDQVEAMSMADYIAIMHYGSLQQYGSPDDVYLRPKNMFVAKFIGSPSMNFIQGHYEVANGQSYLMSNDGVRILLDDRSRRRIESARSREVVLGIRPEHLDFSDDAATALTLPVKVYANEPLGAKTVVHTQLGGQIIQAMVKSGLKPKIGESHSLRMKPDRVYLFDTTTETALA